MRAVFATLALAAVVAVSGACTKTDAAHGEAHAHGDAHGADVKAGAAAAAADKKVDRETVDADGVVRRGTITPDSELISVSQLAAKAADLSGKTVKVQGKVESVCQPMGCWFVIAGDNGETVRVSSKGHNVFMPKSSAGRMAIAEGEFTLKTLSKEQAQHFEDERERKDGDERKVFTEDVKEMSIALVAVELRPAT
jgi:hypothetical protein